MKNKDVLKKVYGYFLLTAWKLHKGYFFIRVFQVLISSATPLLAIFFITAIVAGLVGGKDAGTLLKLAAVMVLIEFFLGIMNGALGNIIERYGQKFENHYKVLLSKRIMELDFQLTENKKALDQLELARNGMSWYSGGINGLMDPLSDFISAILTLLGVAYLILLKAPSVLLISVVIVIATTAVNSRLNKIEQEGYRRLSKINRVFGYLGWGLADFRFGKDIRLYESKDMMVGKWSRYTEELNEENVSITNKQLPLQMINVLTDILHDVAIYFYLGVLAIMGRIAIATCIQMISSANLFTGSLNQIMSCYLDMVKRANYANEFVRFMDYPAAMPKGDREVKAGMHVFEFRNVSFSYPGSETEVLKNVNLTIREGEHLSVVGLNGAGKTTMIKLLCRLYDPTAGEILMDGVNIKEYDYEQYMNIFAPVFQDFKLFAFSIQENLLLKDEGVEEGGYAREDDCPGEDERKVQSTLKQVGIDKKINSLAKGIHTVLFKQFDKDGIEPSGGEQQKIAIARALIKDAPVVILDEPTAALDPIAEYEIYRQFEELVNGKTAIYISHRLSSCQFCDRIAVFAEGCVKEYGTHKELVHKPDGIYARMFAAQAQYYVSGA